MTMTQVLQDTLSVPCRLHESVTIWTVTKRDGEQKPGDEVPIVSDRLHEFEWG